MDYGQILSRAWRIVWENKWLMVLGFLAALGSSGGSGGGGNFNVRNPGDFGSEVSGDFAEVMGEIVPYIVPIVCIFLVIGITFWLLRLIGEAGMIAAVDRIETGEKLTLRDGFNAGKSYLKSMVGLSLLLAAPFLLVALVATVGTISFAVTGDGMDSFASSEFGLLALCLVPLVCVLVIVGIVVTFVYPMAQRSIVLEGLGVMDGIRRGWQVLRKNVVEIILLAVIFAVIGFMVGIVAVIVALPAALIFLVPTIFAVVQGSTAFTIGTIILGVMGAIVFILLVAAVSSVLRAFQSAAFTLGYYHWTSKPAVGMVEEFK